MNYKDVEKRLHAARELLTMTEIDGSTISSLKTLLDGINPDLDKKLARVSSTYAKAEKMVNGNVIDLAVEELPEKTEKQKKRKKALLLFLNTWKGLKSEVARVEKELQNDTKGKGESQSARSPISRIIAGAKGPLGLITIIAVGIVVLNTTAVDIVIRNEGCDPMQPGIDISIPVPGISLPEDPIVSGSEATATVPPISATIDGTVPDVVKLTAYGLHLTFSLNSQNISLEFDGQPLLGRSTQINLGSSSHHTILASCR